MLEGIQNTMRTSSEVMVMELGIRKRKRFREFGAATNMTPGNTLFKMRATHLVTYESGSSKTNVDHCLVRRKQRKFLKDKSLA